MTAEARQYDDLNQTADELWGEDAAQNATEPPSTAAPRVAVSAGRYNAGSIISGKYQLLQVLGEGGMGSVWLARNRTLDVDVALKLMRAELAEDVDGIAERMLQEARAAASIGHPAIIQVFDFGFTEHGDPFIVMELLRGESLSQALRRRNRVSPNRAAQTLLPIIDALAAAHSRGIVHRDLKPENIFLARPAGQRLQPKVLDFGIAKLEQRAAERLTRDGAVIGSPAYMSPEQLRGDRNVDARADIWALTIVLYQMITGRRPFEGDGYQAASWWNVLNAEPKPIAEHGIEEPELWQILKQGLEKEPSARFSDMRAFGERLARYLLARGVHEDIGNASLRTWLDGDSGAGAPIHSFFPSQEPGATGEVLLLAQPSPALVEPATSGERVIGVAAARDAKPQRSFADKRLLWITLVGAVAAFVGASGFAAWAASESEVETAETASPAPERRHRVNSALRAEPSPAPRALDRAPAPPIPSAAPPASLPAPAVKLRGRPARSAPPPARAPKQELKNPFG
ncbi:MAG: serine/threonine-protein kinase [Polyangiaceae bacterium]